MTQIFITLQDQSYLPNIRRIVRSLQGVHSVRVSRMKDVPQKKNSRTDRRGSATFLKGLTIPASTSSRELVDEYLEEKYGV